MHLRIFNLLPDVRADDLDLVYSVSGFTGEESEGKGFETFHDLKVVPGADFFLKLICQN